MCTDPGRRCTSNTRVEFTRFAGEALRGESPFIPTLMPSPDDIADWLRDFPDHAMRGVGLADRSLIALWEQQRELHRGRRIYIWSLDEALIAYDTRGK